MYSGDIEYDSKGCNVKCTSNDGFINATNIAKNANHVILMLGEAHDTTNYQYLMASPICKLGKPIVWVLINGYGFGYTQFMYTIKNNSCKVSKSCMDVMNIVNMYRRR